MVSLNLIRRNRDRVAFGNESFVLTRRGEAVAALVSIKELKLLQELEDQIDAGSECSFRLYQPEPVSRQGLAGAKPKGEHDEETKTITSCYQSDSARQRHF